MHKQIVKALKKVERTPAVKLAIAMNYDFAKRKERMIALPLSYRFDNDLSGWKERYLKKGWNYDVSAISLNQYGEVDTLEDGRWKTAWSVSLDTNEESQGNGMVAKDSGPNYYFIQKDKYVKGASMINTCWRCISTKTEGSVYAVKFETKPVPTEMVLSFTHDEINDIIEQEIKKLRVSVQGDMVRYDNDNDEWIQDTYDAIWSILSEYRTCQQLNNNLRDKGSDLVWLPVNLRGTSDIFGINDMMGQVATKVDDNGAVVPRWLKLKPKTKGGKPQWIHEPLYVRRQKNGADLTLHRIGDTIKTGEECYEEHGWMDVKLDHYAGQSNRISIETHIYTAERGWEKTGWLWKLNASQSDVDKGWITYQVDDHLYIFKLTDLVDEVEKHGDPEFEDWTNHLGVKFRHPKGNFHLNTRDPNNIHTGAGKYGYFISLQNSSRLASRVSAVLPTVLQDVGRRASAFRRFKGDDIKDTMDKWITRMVHLYEAQRG